MSDRQIRALQRVASQGGDAEAEAELLAAHVRMGWSARPSVRVSVSALGDGWWRAVGRLVEIRLARHELAARVRSLSSATAWGSHGMTLALGASVEAFSPGPQFSIEHT